ncbi:MAG: DUF402 domain-containing protein [Firmicutes bacterium]|nr:DUF402 domain-containing protein [Bacillota bacterium]
MTRIREIKHRFQGPTSIFEGTVVERAEGRLVYRFDMTSPATVGGLLLPADGRTYGFFWEDRPYNAYVWVDAAGQPLALYFNVSDRTRITPWEVEWRDLVVDVLVPVKTDAEGAWTFAAPRVLDREELPPRLDPKLREYIDRAVEEILNSWPAVAEEARTLLRRL